VTKELKVMMVHKDILEQTVYKEKEAHKELKVFKALQVLEAVKHTQKQR
jgi:hypothetical protein